MRRMSVLGVAACLLGGVLASSPAKARDWPWCADFVGRGGGSTNCGFPSWQRCRAAISGVGGWCYPNPFYRGEPAPRRRHRRSGSRSS